MDKFNFERMLSLCVAVVCGVVLAVITNAPSWATSEVAAAWAQAIFSVAAILASARLWQADRERVVLERLQDQQIADFRTAVLHLSLMVDALIAIKRIYALCDHADAIDPEGYWLSFNPAAQALEPVAGIVEELKGCSPLLAVDALAAAACARQYIHQVGMTLAYSIDDDYGSRSPGITREGWAVCEPALAGARHRLTLTVARLQLILGSPPDLRVQ